MKEPVKNQPNEAENPATKRPKVNTYQRRLYKAFVRNILIAPGVRNFALLLTAFGMGQGSLFIAQTVLLASGNHTLIRDFGLAFSFFIFAILLVESGSLVTLSRITALAVAKGENADTIWLRYAEICVVRLLIAIGLCSLIQLQPGFIGLDDFSRGFALGVVPALLVWAFNVGGVLDGLKMGGASGMTASLVYFCTGLALVYVSFNQTINSGLLLGLVASFSCAATVTLQFLILYKHGWRLEMHWPSASGIRTAALAAISLLAGTLPGQVLQRVQIVMANQYLPLDYTASIIYVKQIQAALMQVVSFMRRSEFPLLIEGYKADERCDILRSWRLQKKSIILAVASVALFIAIAAFLLMAGRPDGSLPLVFFAIAFPMATETISAYVVQIWYARGFYLGVGIVRVIAVTLGCLIAWLLVPRIALAGIVLAESCVHLLVLVAVWRLISQGAAASTKSQ